ncbi:MAG: hypothetical protein JJE39_03065 [Vicinamibacteria bacterium]|nr:hypothetical protein [Vicinamibacteria bacterium]
MEKKTEEELERIANQATAEMSRDRYAVKTDKKGKEADRSRKDEKTQKPTA